MKFSLHKTLIAGIVYSLITSASSLGKDAPDHLSVNNLQELSCNGMTKIGGRFFSAPPQMPSSIAQQFYAKAYGYVQGQTGESTEFVKKRNGVRRDGQLICSYLVINGKLPTADWHNMGMEIIISPLDENLVRFYKILGVTPFHSLGEIEKAYDHYMISLGNQNKINDMNDAMRLYRLLKEHYNTKD